MATLVDLRVISRIITQRPLQLEEGIQFEPSRDKRRFCAFCRLDNITTTPLGALEFSLYDVHGSQTFFVIPPSDDDNVDGAESFGWSRLQDQPIPPEGIYGFYICSATQPFIYFQQVHSLTTPEDLGDIKSSTRMMWWVNYVMTYLNQFKAHHHNTHYQKMDPHNTGLSAFIKWEPMRERLAVIYAQDDDKASQRQHHQQQQQKKLQ